MKLYADITKIFTAVLCEICLFKTGSYYFLLPKEGKKKSLGHSFPRTETATIPYLSKGRYGKSDKSSFIIRTIPSVKESHLVGGNTMPFADLVNADITAGMELHQSPKNLLFFVLKLQEFARKSLLIAGEKPKHTKKSLYVHFKSE